MIREPFIAYSELTNEIYIVVGKEKYRVTEQAIKAVMAIKALEQELTTKNETLVSLDVYKQVAKERDIAIQQLHELGYDFGQKIEPTTKNDLAVDCLSRAEVNQVIEDYMDEQYNVLSDRTRERAFGAKVVMARINELPSVTPQEPFINKPCISSRVCEHDKQKVLDKIRAEIETKYGQCDICEYFEDYDYEENDISEYRAIGNIADILQIIDKYKAESEEEE